MSRTRRATLHLHRTGSKDFGKIRPSWGARHRGLNDQAVILALFCERFTNERTRAIHLRKSSGGQNVKPNPNTCAAWIARFLLARGLDRIFGLQGGHIQPIWDCVATRGIRIVDVRHEGAAVHMAHAHAELTGKFGAAIVTSGPGVANTVTAIANAHLARAPVLLIGGCPPLPQANMGPLQGIPHVDILRPITRMARTLSVAEQVVRELDEASARCMGDSGEPGPVYVEIPIDVQRARVPSQLILQEWMETNHRDDWRPTLGN